MMREISTADQSESDRFLVSDRGQLTARVERETSSTVQRMELSASGTRQAGGSEQDVQISNLATGGSYIESFGGTTTGATQFFDPLQQFGSRHYLPGLGMSLTRMGNAPYTAPAVVQPETLEAIIGGNIMPETMPDIFDAHRCIVCEGIIGGCYYPKSYWREEPPHTYEGVF